MWTKRCTSCHSFPRETSDKLPTQWVGHNLLMQFSTRGSSKMQISETDFFDNLTIHNDKISYVKHVLDILHVFFTPFGCWRGAEAALKGLRHNLLMQFSTLCSSKMEIFQTKIQNSKFSFSDHSQ